MIAHIVLFRPKPALSEAERRALIDALHDAVAGIAAIRRAQIGRRILLNRAGYESQMAEHYDYAAVLEFDSETELRSYLDHPAHADLGRRLFLSADAVLAYDFTCVEPERVSDLLAP